MIRINLLPYEMRPLKRTPVPYIVAIAFFLGALIYGMLMFFELFSQMRERTGDIDGQKSVLESLAATVEEFESLTSQKESLGYKIQTIQEIIADRVIWSKQLEQLARLTPQNIWYTRIRIISKMEPVWVPKRDRRTDKILTDGDGKEIMERIQMRRDFLEISGYVSADPEFGERDINPLTQALKDDEEFSGRYDLRNTTMEDVDLPQFGKVRKFTLEYLISDVTHDQNQDQQG